MPRRLPRRARAEFDALTRTLRVLAAEPGPDRFLTGAWTHGFRDAVALAAGARDLDLARLLHWSAVAAAAWLPADELARVDARLRSAGAPRLGPHLAARAARLAAVRARGLVTSDEEYEVVRTEAERLYAAARGVPDAARATASRADLERLISDWDARHPLAGPLPPAAGSPAA